MEQQLLKSIRDRSPDYFEITPLERLWVDANCNIFTFRHYKKAGNSNFPVQDIPFDTRIFKLRNIRQSDFRGSEKSVPVLQEQLRDRDFEAKKPTPPQKRNTSRDSCTFLQSSPRISQT